MGKKLEFSVEDPMANSSQFVLPRTTAPAPLQSFHRCGVVQEQRNSTGCATRRWCGFPRRGCRPLTATGTPASGAERFTGGNRFVHLLRLSQGSLRAQAEVGLDTSLSFCSICAK